MMKNTFQYMLRFCCDPYFNAEEETAALEKYAEAADIDDAVVFANAEDMNTGHMDEEEQDVYLAMMAKIKEKMALKGVTFSVNHWHTVMHDDLGHQLRKNQHFRKMVDVNGREAAVCVCPLCGEWQEYIGNVYARYAQLHPRILWVEDDFRLHNHAPLVWGGCFCQEHMRIYSEKAGKKLTREEFINGVLKKGKPHPYRKIWLDTARDTMLSAAEKIGTAVRSVSEDTQVGLMSSVPFVHAAEGRNWHSLLKNLCQDQIPVIRIHLPAYQETAPFQYLLGFNRVSMMNRAMIPKETEVYPELENYPFGLFSDSRKFTRFQLLSSLPLDNQGIMLDLYDLNGNGIVWEDGYEKMLKKTKPYLNRITKQRPFSGERMGVRVLYCETSAYTLHTKKGLSMEELYPEETFFAMLLPAMGIPYFYTDDISETGEIFAVSGQALLNFDEKQIRHLFENNFVILSGDALVSLQEMGLLHLAGVENIQVMKQNGGEFSYEQVTNGKIYRGHQSARASAVISCADALRVTYLKDDEVKEYTAFFDCFRKRCCAAQTVISQKVMIYPFVNLQNEVPPMLLNGVRAEVMQDILTDRNIDFPLILNAAYLEPYCARKGKKEYVYLINGSLDDQTDIYIRTKFTKAEADGSCMEKPQTVFVENGKISLSVPAMETVLLTFEQED